MPPRGPLSDRCVGPQCTMSRLYQGVRVVHSGGKSVYVSGGSTRYSEWTSGGIQKDLSSKW